MAENTEISELWRTSLQWLKACGFRPSKKFIESEITSHPDYPALTSLVDMLDAGGFAYNAVSTDLSYRSEFTYPLLAHIRRGTDEQGLLLLHNDRDWDAKTDLKENWTGVLVMPEPGAQWQHPDNEAAVQKERQQATANYVAAAVVVLLVLGSFWQHPDIFTAIFLLLSAAGLIFSWLTFNTELGVQSKLVKQVCNSVNPEGGCDKVLKSRQASGFLGITPADASLAWFGVQFPALLAAVWLPGVQGLLPAAAQIALAGIAAAVWSIASQYFIVKQWCALCLSIASVLVLQFAAAWLIPGATEGFALKYSLLYAVAGILLLLLVIKPVKQLIKSSTEGRNFRQQLKKWQQDAGVFNGLWQQQDAADTTPWSADLQLGNAAAPVQLVVACNPYCGPCAKAHDTLDALLKKQAQNIGVTVRFTVNTKHGQDKRVNAVRLLLRECAGKTPVQKAAAVHDWFKFMDEEKWLALHNPDKSLDVEDILQQHEAWAEASAIQFTPTFFINGRRMPGQYKVDDLAVLLPQLSSQLMEEETAA